MTETISKDFQRSLQGLSELERVARAYAKFSRDAVGLGHVLGGGLLFLSVYLLHHIRVGMFGRLCWAPRRLPGFSPKSGCGDTTTSSVAA